MSTTVGFRVHRNIVRPEKELIESFRGIPSSNINDEMNRLYCMSAAIKPYNDVTSMVGSAFTVKAPVGDNLMIHKAMDLAKPGDILVVDGAGSLDRSLMGEMMVTFAEKKGLAGIVIDGALRDVDGISTNPMPVYAKGVNPQGPYKNGPGEIGCPVCCGGIVVFPGDILVGDKDGIVVIRPADAPDVLKCAKAKFENESEKLEKYACSGADEEQHATRIEKALDGKGLVYVE